MSKLKDLTGKKFNRWTVIEKAKSINGQTAWLCVCDCGVKKSVRGNDLKSGKSKSCKCLNYETSTTHGLSKTKIYNVWTNMIERCEEKNRNKYKNYSGRGIKVCDEWKCSFKAFYDDMFPTYKDGLSIDRINNDGDYNKNNCKWSTSKEQNNNKRNTKRYEYNGKLISPNELSIITGIDKELIRTRIRRGYSLEEAINKPKREEPNKEMIIDMYKNKESIRSISLKTNHSWECIKNIITKHIESTIQNNN